MLVLTKAAAAAYSFVIAPMASFALIPRNWYRVVLCTDVCHPPELAVGAILEERGFGASILQPIGFLSGGGLDSCLDLSAETSNSDRIFSICIYLSKSILFASFAIPAWAYRWSVKSTALIYFPLLWFVWDAPRTTPKAFVDSISMKGLFGASLALTATGIGAILRSREIRFREVTWLVVAYGEKRQCALLLGSMQLVWARQNGKEPAAEA